MNRILYYLLCIVVLFTISSTANAQIITLTAGNGTYGYAGDGGNATSAQLKIPTTITRDAAGNVYFCDQLNHCVRRVSPAGIITTVAGNGSLGYAGDGGLATAARLNGNWGVASDASGNLYITDQWNYVVRKVNTSGVISTVAGTGVQAYTGDGGPATSATFRRPLGIAVDNSGNIYVGDVDNYCVRRIDAFGTITTWAGTGIAGNGPDGGPATATRIGYIWGMATDNAGNLYLCDGDNHKVRKVSPTGIITTVAGTGVAGFSGDGGPAVTARFNKPVGVALLNNGALLVADCNNHRIRKISPDGVVRTIAGTGTSGYNGEGIPATSARINGPAGMVADENDNIYFCDVENTRVRKIANILYFNKGDTAHFSVCQNTGPSSINNLLAVTDIYPGLTDTWTLEIAPLHGTASVAYSATSPGGIIVPSGLFYTPYGGYSGQDSFDVRVTNVYTTDVIRIYVSVDPLLSPGIISGPSSVCIGDTVRLTNTVAGGIWSAAGSSIGVTVSGIDGIIRGLNPGIDTVRYSITNGCGTAVATYAITVNPLPNPGSVSGPEAFCLGATVLFTSNVSGGIWSTNNTNTTVNSSGQVRGEAPGTSVIIYTVSNAWCSAVAIRQVVVEIFPDAGFINGPSSVCVGNTIQLRDTVPNGVWTSTNAFISVEDGYVTGVTPGNDFVNYAVTNSCGTDIATWPVTVYANPLSPNVSVVLGVLYATQGANSYQWQLNGVDIPGAVTDTLYALETGAYRVVITNEYGCEASSEPVNYTGCSADDMQIMPNPTSGELSIIWCKKVNAILYTADGRKIGYADEVRKISMGDIPSGFYILKVYDVRGEHIRSVKIVKQ
jgi:hypothetical protein